jgi:hypothetical protein
MTIIIVPEPTSPRKVVSYKLDPKNDRVKIERVCRQDDRPPDRTIVRGKQIAHLRKVFEGRIAEHLYDAEPDRKHVIALLRVLASIPNIRSSTLMQNAWRWVPSATKGEIDDLVSKASSRPCVFRKETLGRLIRLTDDERKKFKAWSIWPIDLSLAEARLRRQEHDRDQKAENRIKAGATPRSESLSQTQPWVAEGISRSTWERRRRARDANSSPVLKSLSKEKVLVIEPIAGDEFASNVLASAAQPTPILVPSPPIVPARAPQSAPRPGDVTGDEIVDGGVAYARRLIKTADVVIGDMQ